MSGSAVPGQIQGVVIVVQPNEASGRTTQVLPYVTNVSMLPHWLHDGSSFALTETQSSAQIWLIDDIR